MNCHRERHSIVKAMKCINTKFQHVQYKGSTKSTLEEHFSADTFSSVWAECHVALILFASLVNHSSVSDHMTLEICLHNGFKSSALK